MKPAFVYRPETIQYAPLILPPPLPPDLAFPVSPGLYKVLPLSAV